MLPLLHTSALLWSLGYFAWSPLIKVRRIEHKADVLQASWGKDRGSLSEILMVCPGLCSCDRESKHPSLLPSLWVAASSGVGEIIAALRRVMWYEVPGPHLACGHGISFNLDLLPPFCLYFP